MMSIWIDVSELQRVLPCLSVLQSGLVELNDPAGILSRDVCRKFTSKTWTKIAPVKSELKIVNSSTTKYINVNWAASLYFRA